MASDAADLTARVALQVHGAIGYTWECDLHFFLKRRGPCPGLGRRRHAPAAGAGPHWRAETLALSAWGCPIPASNCGRRATMAAVIEDPDRCYQAAQSKDARFDGQLLRRRHLDRDLLPSQLPRPDPQARERALLRPPPRPSRPATGPACAAGPTPPPVRRNGTCGPTSSARHAPHPTTASVDREGVEGLADRLGYSTRQLNRLLTAEVGTGPLALARAQRSQTARVCSRPPSSRSPTWRSPPARQRAPVQRDGAPDLRRHAERPATRAARTAQAKRARRDPSRPRRASGSDSPVGVRSHPRRPRPRPARAARVEELDGASMHAQPAVAARPWHRDLPRPGRRRARRPRLRGGRDRAAGPA